MRLPTATGDGVRQSTLWMFAYHSGACVLAHAGGGDVLDRPVDRGLGAHVDVPHHRLTSPRRRFKRRLTPSLDLRNGYRTS
ncbi:MAG: hypothetical protein M3Q22_08105 [Actinomycetota bacterium]|nr:hypothetical protein [Actinomycetota bacterium]